MRIELVVIAYDNDLTFDVLVEGLKSVFQSNIEQANYTGDSAKLHKFKINVASKVYYDLQDIYRSKKFTGKGKLKFQKYEAKILFESIKDLKLENAKMLTRQIELIDQLIQDIFDIEVRNPASAAFDLFTIPNV